MLTFKEYLDFWGFTFKLTQKKDQYINEPFATQGRKYCRLHQEEDEDTADLKRGLLNLKRGKGLRKRFITKD